MSITKQMGSVPKSYARLRIIERLSKAFPFKTRAACEVLMLPERGREIPILQKKGFTHLHCVERDTDIFEQATWVGKDGLTAYLGEIGEVSLKMASEGIRIDAAILDLCGTTSHKMVTTIENVLLGGCTASRAFVAVTLMKSREDSAIVNAIKCMEDYGLSFPQFSAQIPDPLMQPTFDEIARVKILLAGVYSSRTVEDMEIFAYQNGLSRMICATFIMLPGKEVDEMSIFEEFVRDQSRGVAQKLLNRCVGKNSQGIRCTFKASTFCICGAPLCGEKRNNRSLPQHYTAYCKANHSTKNLIGKRS